MIKNKAKHSYRFERRVVREFSSDSEAIHYANGWYDERDASIEKWIDGGWRPAASPIHHPRYFEGGRDGGWIVNENELVEYQF